MKKVYLIVVMLLTISFNLNANNLIEIPIIDNKWKLVGVPGGFCEGSTSSSLTSGWYYGTDSNDSNDTYQTVTSDGSTKKYDANSDVIGFYILTSDGTVAFAKLNVDVSGHSYNYTSPTRITYASFDSNGATAHLLIKYQSHFEGETYEVRTNYNTEPIIFEGTFDSTATITSPQVLTEKTSSCTNCTNYHLGIIDTLDMNFSNNPGKDGRRGDLTDYVSTSNKDAKDAQDYLQVYRFDSYSYQWETYDTRNSDAVNDFDTFVPGASYWVYLYDYSDDGDDHGFIFGDGNLSVNSYSDNTAFSATDSTTSKNDHGLIENNTGKTDFWTLLAFDDGVLRHSPTGLYLEYNRTSSLNKGFVVSDNLGVETVSIETFDLGGDVDCNATELARIFNLTFAKAQAQGDISSSFNIRAFVSNDAANDHIILLSDDRFRVYDKNGTYGTSDDIFGAVTTIGNKAPLDLSTNGYETVTDLGTTGVASKYGEYSVIIRPNNSAGDGNLTGPLAKNIGKIAINGSIIDISTETTIDGIKNTIVSDSDDIDAGQIIDTDFDGLADSIILVDRNDRFYIQDYTFTRVFKLDTNDSAVKDRTLYIDDGKGNQKSITTKGSNASTVASDINLSNSYGLKATSSGDYIFVFTHDVTYKNFDIKDDTTDDILTPITSSTNALALGAITKVYSVSEIAQSDVTKSEFQIYIEASSVNSDDDLNITINSETASYDMTSAGDINATDICSALKSDLNSLNGHVFAECNSTSTTDINASMVIEGYFSTIDIASTTEGNVTYNNGQDGTITSNYDPNWISAKTGGDLDSISAIASNLGYNYYEWSPDFPTERGPINFIKNAGYDLKIMMSAVNDTSGNIDWEYLNATNDIDNWFDTYDNMNLFRTSNNRGYWTYVSKSDGTTSITVDAPSYSTVYVHHYNNEVNNTTDDNLDRSVSNVIQSMSIQATVDGVLGTKENVILNLNGRQIPMYDYSGSGIYKTTISSYDYGYLPDNTFDITVEFFDEYGNYAVSNSVEFDNEAPDTPTAIFIAPAILLIASTSNDIYSFNLYSGTIEDTDPTPTSTDGTNFVTTITSDNDYEAGSGTTFSINGDSQTTSTLMQNSQVYKSSNSTQQMYYLAFNICEITQFDKSYTGWRVVAVDGNGDADNSRVSNISYIGDANNNGENNDTTFYNFLKGASILESTGTMDSEPNIYGSDCLTYSSSSDDNGVGLQAESGYDLTISYEGTSGADLTGSIPFEGWIKIDDNVKGKIQFVASEYVTSLNANISTAKAIFIYDAHNGNIYRTTFDDLYSTDGTDSDPVVLDGSEIGLSGQYISK